MAASAKVEENSRGLSVLRKQVANAAVIYHRAKIALRGPSHATSASIGYVAPFAAAAGNIPLGPANPHKVPEAGGSDTSVTGNTSASPKPTAGVENLEGGYVLENKAVTGFAAKANEGQWVYLSDDDTLTLTRPAIGIPVGLSWNYRSSGYGDVVMFDMQTMLAIAAAGCAIGIVPIGTYLFSNTADGNLRTGIPLQGHGKIINWFVMISDPIVGSGGTVTLNLELGGTNVTDGTIVVSTAVGGTLGTKLVPTTPPSAENEFHEGTLLDVECASAGGTRTSGMWDAFLIVEWQPGL